MNTNRLIALFLALLVLTVAGWYWWQRSPGELVLRENTTWSAPAEGDLTVNQRVVVPAGVTLTIQPGTTVLFGPRAGLRIQGQLLAEGEPAKRIRLARPRVPVKLWAGIQFENATKENRLCYLDLDSAGSEGQALLLTNAVVTIEHVRFLGAQRTAIRAQDSTLTLRESVFHPAGEHEVMVIARVPAGGRVLIEGNTFYPNFGYNDIIELTDCRPPGGIARVVDNLFLGGGDDGIDADGSHVEITGNIFTGFRLQGHKKFADGVQGGGGSQLMVTNNLFVGNDGGVMVAGGGRATLVNNTFVRHRLAAVWLSERELTGGGAVIRDCVFWENGASFAFAERATQLVVSNSVLPEAERWPGQGNLAGDPGLADPANGDFRLRPDSPAAGRGTSIGPEQFPRGVLVAE